MSRLSDNRIAALARLVLRVVSAAGEIGSERAALAECKRTLGEHFRQEEKIDEAVRKKIASLSRRVMPGSTEWDVLYRRYFEEELRKQRL
ncbi:MAG: DUF507 family protein [Thermodesulfobacteriota bacterium]